ncbi:iron complex transport system substrate-binding protein [Asanoa ferruginea]|uniref:Iron complex transport system substrate-binding protein n=1 Tax=Asanoa ferruginea TaxID=53367 RepID=A0A3D9ZEX7_9ACTN|nr:ABC transporter substrate-binding protein [Asanoa ferruginea]REF95787.1 iron complex transport system substrate-binding protein [Asanoa ferruginea]GIF51286.1 ABC transporter substrate-binding protein [Asanoa ferruginea]
MRYQARIVAAALGAALLLAGCGDGGSTENGGTPPDTNVSATPDFPVTVGDLTVATKPTKIVALSPTATEVLFAIGAGPQVVAVDDQSNFPANAPKSDLSAFQPNAEAIAGKSPDLVVLSNDMNNVVAQLRQLKIPVYVAPAGKTLDDTYRQITDIGALTGNRPAAEDLAKQMRTDVDKLVKDVPQRSTKLTYYYELGPELYSLTSKTFVGSLFAQLGLENIADPADADGSKGGYPQLSAESLVKADPDLIFLADTVCCQQNADSVKARPGWSGITAVKSGQIVGLNDDIASRWGPRTVDLLRQIVDAVSKVPA